MATKEIENIQPTYYRNFACIGPACTDNCCHSWRVTVDKEHYLRYMAVQDPDFHKLCSVGLIRDKKTGTNESYAIMALRIDGRCIFQDSDGGCHIFRVLGPDSLCGTCTIYPRRKNQFLPHTLEFSLSLSCEEAARVALLSGGPVVFERFRRELDPADPIDKMEPLHTGGGKGAVPAPYCQPLRNACLELMQHQDATIQERILAIGLLMRRADRLFRSNQEKQIPDAAAQFLLQAKAGEFSGLFERMEYNRNAHLSALELPAVHLMTAVRKPVLRQVWAALKPLCGQNSAREYYLGEEAMAFLLQQGQQKADPIFAQYAQAIENYFVSYIFTSTFPFSYFLRGLSFEYHSILLAEQYALFRILLGLLPAREGETTQQQLIRSVVALARITQHADLGRQVYDIGKAINLDSLAHAAYLLR